MARNRYRITLYDAYERELDRLHVQAYNLRWALLVSEAAMRGRRAGHGQDAVSASVDLVGDYSDTLPPGRPLIECGVTLGVIEPEPEPEPEGNVTCDYCGVVFAWAGEPPTDCLRCGRNLLESAALARPLGELPGDLGHACIVDESAGQAELHSIRHELHPSTETED